MPAQQQFIESLLAELSDIDMPPDFPEGPALPPEVQITGVPAEDAQLLVERGWHIRHADIPSLGEKQQGWTYFRGELANGLRVFVAAQGTYGEDAGEPSPL